MLPYKEFYLAMPKKRSRLTKKQVKETISKFQQLVNVTCHAKTWLMRFFLKMHFIMHSCRAIFALFIATYCVKIG